MKNIALLGIGGVVLIGLFIIAYKFTSPDKATPQTSQVATTTTQGNTKSPVTNISLLPSASPNTSPSVDSTQAKGILQDPDLAKDSMNPGYYYLGYHTSQGNTDSTATIAPPYIIEYIDTTHYFNIALLQEPIGITRETMQRYLMLRLGLSEDQMCKLDYMVSVPEKVNAFYSRKNLGFSFCPGATSLPTK